MLYSEELGKKERKFHKSASRHLMTEEFELNLLEIVQKFTDS